MNQHVQIFNCWITFEWVVLIIYLFRKLFSMDYFVQLHYHVGNKTFKYKL